MSPLTWAIISRRVLGGNLVHRRWPGEEMGRLGLTIGVHCERRGIKKEKNPTLLMLWSAVLALTAWQLSHKATHSDPRDSEEMFSCWVLTASYSLVRDLVLGTRRSFSIIVKEENFHPETPQAGSTASI